MMFMHHFYIPRGPIFHAYEDASKIVESWINRPDQEHLFAGGWPDIASLSSSIARLVLKAQGYDEELVDEISDLDPCTPNERSKISDLMVKLEASRKIVR